MEDILGIIDHIRCHTSKGNGQTIEIDGVDIRPGKLIEKRRDILTHNKASPLAPGFLLAEGKAARIDIGILFLALM